MVRWPGVNSFILVLSIAPLWLVAAFGFGFLNSAKPATLYWYYYPYWICAGLWVLAPAVFGIGRLFYVWSTHEQPLIVWDVGVGFVAILVFFFCAFFLYRFHSMVIVPSVL